MKKILNIIKIVTIATVFIFGVLAYILSVFNNSSVNTKMKIYLNDRFDSEWYKLEQDIHFEYHNSTGYKLLYWNNYSFSAQVKSGKELFGPIKKKYKFSNPISITAYINNDIQASVDSSNDATIMITRKGESGYLLVNKSQDDLINDSEVEEKFGISTKTVLEEIQNMENSLNDLVQKIHKSIFPQVVKKIVLLFGVSFVIEVSILEILKHKMRTSKTV